MTTMTIDWRHFNLQEHLDKNEGKSPVGLRGADCTVVLLPVLPMFSRLLAQKIEQLAKGGFHIKGPFHELGVTYTESQKLTFSASTSSGPFEIPPNWRAYIVYSTPGEAALLEAWRSIRSAYSRFVLVDYT